MIIMHTAAYIL